MADWDPIRDGLESEITSFCKGALNRQLLKHCLTGYGQKYALFAKENNEGLHEVHMVTANARNQQVISPVMKLSCPLDVDSALSLISVIETHFSPNPTVDFTRPPVNCRIPTNHDLMTLSELPDQVHANPDAVLLPGDEIFVRYITSDGTDFHHSGIYVEGGWMIHFANSSVTDHASLSTSLSSLNSAIGAVRCEPWHSFVHACGRHASVPRCFRVTHPLLVREGRVIVAIAKQLMENGSFSHYNTRFRNCQHFSSLCSYGVEFSYDADRVLLRRGACSAPQLPAAPLKPLQVPVIRPRSRSPAFRQNQNNQGVSNGAKSKYVATFEMPDSEYFAL